MSSRRPAPAVVSLVEAATRVLLGSLPGRSIVPQSSLSAVLAAEPRRRSGLSDSDRRLLGCAELRARVYSAASHELEDLADFEAAALRQKVCDELGPGLRGLCHAAVAEAYLVCGRDRAARGQALLAAAFGDEADDDACRYRAMSIQACALALSGDARRAQAEIERSVALEQKHGWVPNTAALPLILADLLIACLELDADAINEVYRLLAALPSPGPIWVAYRQLASAWLHFARGAYDRAVVSATRLTAGPDRELIPSLITGLALELQALALGYRGEPMRALNVLAEAESQGDHALCFDMHRAAVHLQLGEDREALVATDSCMRLGARHNLRTMPGVLLRRAVAHLRLGHHDPADNAFAEALHLLGELKAMSPLIGLEHADLKVLLERHVSRAPEEIEASEMFQEYLEVCPPMPLAQRMPSLTPREAVVADWLRHDLPLREIAARLYISTNTLKTQMRMLYAKLEVSSRQEAVGLLERSGFYERRREPTEAS